MKTTSQPDPSPEQITELIDRHCAQLSEHFDTVQVFVTKFGADGGTRCIARGTGNWYARYGYIREWMTREDERTRFDIRSELEG